MSINNNMVTFLLRMRCRRMTIEAAESLNMGGVSRGAPVTAVGGVSSGKTSEAQVTRTSGGRNINMERGQLGSIKLWGKFFDPKN